MGKKPANNMQVCSDRIRAVQAADGPDESGHYERVRKKLLTSRVFPARFPGIFGFLALGGRGGKMVDIVAICGILQFVPFGKVVQHALYAEQLGGHSTGAASVEVGTSGTSAASFFGTV